MELPKDELRLQELSLLRNYASGELRQEIDRQLETAQNQATKRVNDSDDYRVHITSDHLASRS